MIDKYSSAIITLAWLQLRFSLRKDHLREILLCTIEKAGLSNIEKTKRTAHNIKYKNSGTEIKFNPSPNST